MDFELLTDLLPLFGAAALNTAALLFLGLCGGLSLGFTLNLMRAMRGGGWVLRFYRAYTAVMRGVPFLVHLFIVYYGFPDFGLSFDPLTAAALSLSLYGGAYFAEIFRACWQSLPVGQIEAAHCMGLSPRQTFLRIECPQALRASLPLIANQTILLMKESALASIITYPELTMTTGKIVSERFVYIEPYLLLALSYWLLATVIERAGQWVRVEK
jgi:polar amino acid transport system permease protein